MSFRRQEPAAPQGPTELERLTAQVNAQLDRAFKVADRPAVEGADGVRRSLETKLRHISYTTNEGDKIAAIRELLVTLPDTIAQLEQSSARYAAQLAEQAAERRARHQRIYNQIAALVDPALAEARDQAAAQLRTAEQARLVAEQALAAQPSRANRDLVEDAGIALQAADHAFAAAEQAYQAAQNAAWSELLRTTREEMDRNIADCEQQIEVAERARDVAIECRDRTLSEITEASRAR